MDELYTYYDEWDDELEDVGDDCASSKFDTSNSEDSRLRNRRDDSCHDDAFPSERHVSKGNMLYDVGWTDDDCLIEADKLDQYHVGNRNWVLY